MRFSPCAAVALATAAFGPPARSSFTPHRPCANPRRRDIYSVGPLRSSKSSKRGRTQQNKPSPTRGARKGHGFGHPTAKGHRQTHASRTEFPRNKNGRGDEREEDGGGGAADHGIDGPLHEHEHLEHAEHAEQHHHRARRGRGFGFHPTAKSHGQTPTHVSRTKFPRNENGRGDGREEDGGAADRGIDEGPHEHEHLERAEHEQHHRRFSDNFFKTPELRIPKGFGPDPADARGHSEEEERRHHHRHRRNPVAAALSQIMSGAAAAGGGGGGVGPRLVSHTPEWRSLQKHAERIRGTHLRDLLTDAERCDSMRAFHDGVYLDYSRQRATLGTLGLLLDLAERQDVRGKIDSMMRGERINFTEDRAVLHTALRARRDQIGSVIVDDGVDAVGEVYDVLDRVRYFTNAVRSGDIRGYTGRRLRNIVSVGIGGSYLGPEFLHEVLKTEPEGANSALGYGLRFLSNVDPVDVERTCADLDPEETLIVIVSKTFATAETMLNARTMRQWLWDFMGDDAGVVRKHVVACASVSAVDGVKAFGIDAENYFFRFWDWVGGRYSVCSAAGAVPISLLYGYDLFEKFLEGARSIDEHFKDAPLDRNIPVIMGLLGVWNMSFLGYNARTTLPYAEALLKLPAHIQQLDMESNGKHVTRSGLEVDYPVGEVDFGEPGTNGQHSFFQLLHMGQTVPCDFIGFVRSQRDLCIDGESLSSHDELMSNFFAQPDALANGRTADEVRAEGVEEGLVAHRTFGGNRPSVSLLLPKLTAYAAGQLLSIYEHRTAVQGFVWDINSFDQWGVELGKELAVGVREKLAKARADPTEPVEAENPATSRMLNYYVRNGRDTCRDGDAGETNALTSVTGRTYGESSPPPRGSDLGEDAVEL